MRRTLVILLLLGIVGYGLFEARKLLEGPQVTVEFPQNGSATSSPTLAIHGVAKNISFLTINDLPAYTDAEGNFTQIISPPAGYTVVTVAGIDRFGRRASQSVAVTITNYCPANA